MPSLLGKSVLIRLLQRVLRKKLLCAAFTGSAACQINSSTIHSTLQQPAFQKTHEAVSGEPLSTVPTQKKKLEENFLGVQYYMVDEISMISQHMLTKMDHSLRKATGINEPFGNLSVILIGDFCQLRPHGGHPLFSTAPGRKKEAMNGGMLYHTLFTNVFILNESKRQVNASAGFISVLNALATGRCLYHEDYKVLESRHINVVAENDPDELLKFKGDDTVVLYTTNKKVDLFNYHKVKHFAKEQNVPLLTALSKGEIEQMSISKSKFHRMQCVLLLCVGAQVMLLNNEPFWTEYGVCNGATGKYIVMCMYVCMYYI